MANRKTIPYTLHIFIFKITANVCFRGNVSRHPIPHGSKHECPCSLPWNVPINNDTSNLLIYPPVNERAPQYTGKDDGKTYEKVQFISCSIDAHHDARL